MKDNSGDGVVITCALMNAEGNLCTTHGNVCISYKWTKRLVDGSARCCIRVLKKFLMPNGIISSEIAEEVEAKERQQQEVYRLPRMEEEEDRVLWWMYNK